jgi:hypothetical protein
MSKYIYCLQHIRKGKCSTEVSCSWPPGMSCVPTEGEVIGILRWNCRKGKDTSVEHFPLRIHRGQNKLPMSVHTKWTLHVPWSRSHRLNKSKVWSETLATAFSLSVNVILSVAKSFKSLESICVLQKYLVHGHLACRVFRQKVKS